jgi:predicted  nucleic acid-binding Zn-ribbon protein
LSETPRFSSKDIKGWLERETGSVFIPVHTKAQKLIDEMRRTLDSLSEVSKMLMDNSAKEIEKRNMKVYRRARALNRLARLFCERMRQLKVPDKVSYDSFSEFLQELQKAFTVTDVDIRNWFPRISPFFILDRRRFQTIFEKAKESLKDLQNFLAKEYVKTKTLEETFQLIDKLLDLEQQLKNLDDRMAKTGSDKACIEKEIAEAQQKMAELRSRGSIGQLHQTGTEIDSLSMDVKHSLQHLQKPFIKLQSLSTHGGGSGLTPEELGKLYQYLENPFEAFSTEAPGHPLLRQILLKLDRSISEGKLKLKPEKIRKAEQTIDSIVNRNSLADLHQKSRDAMARKTQLSTSEEVTVMQENLSKIQAHVEDLTRKRGVVETEEASIKRAREETSEKIHSHKAEIEKNIFSFLNKTIRIE